MTKTSDQPDPGSQATVAVLQDGGGGMTKFSHDDIRSLLAQLSPAALLEALPHNPSIGLVIFHNVPVSQSGTRKAELLALLTSRLDIGLKDRVLAALREVFPAGAEYEGPWPDSVEFVSASPP